MKTEGYLVEVGGADEVLRHRHRVVEVKDPMDPAGGHEHGLPRVLDHDVHLFRLAQLLSAGGGSRKGRGYGRRKSAPGNRGQGTWNPVLVGQLGLMPLRNFLCRPTTCVIVG